MRFVVDGLLPVVVGLGGDGSRLLLLGDSFVMSQIRADGYAYTQTDCYPYDAYDNRQPPDDATPPPILSLS